MVYLVVVHEAQCLELGYYYIVDIYDGLVKSSIGRFQFRNSQLKVLMAI